MVSKEEFRMIVDSTSEKVGLTQEQMAIELGYGKNYISDILSPTGKVSEKFVNAFKKHFGHSSENTNDDNGNNNQDEAIDYLTLKKIFLELSTSHKNFSAAHKEIATTNRLLAEENRDLRKNTNLSGTGRASPPSRAKEKEKHNPVQKEDFLGKPKIRLKGTRGQQKNILKEKGN